MIGSQPVREGHHIIRMEQRGIFKANYQRRSRPRAIEISTILVKVPIWSSIDAFDPRILIGVERIQIPRTILRRMYMSAERGPPHSVHRYALLGD